VDAGEEWEHCRTVKEKRDENADRESVQLEEDAAGSEEGRPGSRGEKKE
jgi:hypothetical protein